MKHVSPHRWADAWAGKLADAEVAAMDRHAEECARCAKARDRITRASSQTFPAIRSSSVPDVAWDSVRAKVHWTLSTERHARIAPAHRTRWWVGALAAGGLAAALATGSLRRAHHEAAPVVATKAPAPEAPRALDGLVSRLAGDVLVDGLAAAFDHPIHAGDMLATGPGGRVDVQFGDKSAFALGPRTRLEVRLLDAQAIELAVDGTVDVEVAPRAAGQTFKVIAGAQTIEVRGTQFRVVRDGATVRVACRHGKVEVSDGSGKVLVEAARVVEVRGAVGDTHVAQMSADELAQLAAATPVTTPVFGNAAATTALEIAGTRDVRVDGIEVGAAPVRVRVMPGRHTVEAADRAGRYHRADWVDTSAAEPARFELHAEPEASATPKAAERQRQFHAGIAAKRAQLARCTRSMMKMGITDLAIEIRIGVTAAGDVDHLNVDTDLPAEPHACIEEVLHDVRFGPGAAAEWHEKLSL